MGTIRRDIKYLPCIFKGRHGRTWQLIGWAALPVLQPYLWIIQFQGHKQLKRKDNSSRGSCRRLQARLCCHMLSTADLRNINPIPFWQLRREAVLHCKDLPYALGSSNPWPIAVLMEPFPTSVFKVLIWIFATTTKICTIRRSTQAHAKGFYTMTDTPSYSLRPRICHNGWVSVLQFSAIHFQG